MKFLQQLGAVMLLLAASVAPAMACVAFGGHMTVEERACCSSMQSQCGQMVMPDSHDCCKKAPTGLHSSALKANTVSLYPIVAVLGISHSGLFQADDATNGWVQHVLYSPPQSPPATASILRI